MSSAQNFYGTASVLQCTSILQRTMILLMSSHESYIIQIKDRGIKTTPRLKTYLLNYFVFYTYYCSNEIFGTVLQMAFTQCGNCLIAANNLINNLTRAINPAPTAPSQARFAVRPQATDVVRASQHQSSHTSGSQSQP
uniref:Uncharacterized protein n=1 Tax=Amphimedon queenslandica TaxID=400682 RepID=A0A1X7TTI3_AMPQE